MPRVVITLGEQESEALQRLARAKYRTPRDQIRFIVREALQNENLLPADSNKPEKKGDSK